MDNRKNRYGTGGYKGNDAKTKSAPLVGGPKDSGQAYNKVPKTDKGNTYTTKNTEG